jgi:hypothetical protein
LARRVIQFPVRNAFAAQRSQDSLARDTQDSETQLHAHRIATRVENEIARLAESQATGNRTAFETARSRDVLVLRPTSRATHLRKRITALRAAIQAFTSKLITRS